MGGDPPTEITKNDWPKIFLTAYEEQEKIGWEQGFLGHLSTKWDVLSEYNSIHTYRQVQQNWVE